MTWVTNDDVNEFIIGLEGKNNWKYSDLSLNCNDECIAYFWNGPEGEHILSVQSESANSHPINVVKTAIQITETKKGLYLKIILFIYLFLLHN